MAERRYSISQAGRLVGVENHVLRYWEDESASGDTAGQKKSTVLYKAAY